MFGGENESLTHTTPGHDTKVVFDILVGLTDAEMPESPERPEGAERQSSDQSRINAALRKTIEHHE